MPAVERQPKSEYSGENGWPGSIAPAPHVPVASERLMLLYATNESTQESGEDITGLIGKAPS